MRLLNDREIGGVIYYDKGGRMLAQEVIERCVKLEYQDKSYVHAHIPEKDSWWHVHRDEEVPSDRPISIAVHYQGFKW